MPEDLPISRKTYHPEGGRLMTKQHHALESDVNNIVHRHRVTGTPLPTAEPSYGDFTNAVDYHTAANRLLQAEQQFLALPSHIRSYCHNDPGVFLDLVFDPERRAELQELGLLPIHAPKDAPDAKPPETPTPATSLVPTP